MNAFNALLKGTPKKFLILSAMCWLGKTASIYEAESRLS